MIDTQSQLFKNATSAYSTMIADIHAGENLPEHLAEAEKAIGIIDEAIQHAQKTGQRTEGYDKLRNELFALVYGIKERI